MYEDACSFHLNGTADVTAETTPSLVAAATAATAAEAENGFSQQHIVLDTLGNFEDNRNQNHPEEFSSCQQNLNQLCLKDDESAGHIATLLPHQEHMGIDVNNSTCSNYHVMVAPLLQEVQGSNDLLSYDSSAWDTNLNEIQELVHHGDLHQQVQNQLDQQFQQIVQQNGVQSYNSSSLPDTAHPYPTPDLLINLLQLPSSSGGSFSTNSSMPFPNPSQKTAGSYQNSLGFLGELQSTGMDQATGSSVMYDPLFHLNLPPQPPIFRELFQSLPNGYSLPTSRHGSLFGGSTHEMDGHDEALQDEDGRQFGNGVFQFTSGDMPCVGKGCKDGENTKHFATEKQRRIHLNDRFHTLRSLIPCPTKIDRASIVGDAIGHIKELLSSVRELQILVENKRYGRDKMKRRKTEGDIVGGDEIEDGNTKPMGDSDHCHNRSLRSSWIQRKSKDTEVDVKIIDDEVTIKLVQRKKINCLSFVSKILDEFVLDLQYVAGGHIGDYWSFLFNTKINVGSSVYASAVASKMMEVMDRQYAAAISDTARTMNCYSRL